MPKAPKIRELKSIEHAVDAKDKPRASDGVSTAWRLPNALILTLVCGAVFAVYCNAMTGQFLFDDRYSIVENKSIRSVFPLSQSLWGPRDMPTAGRPVANLSFAFNYAVGQLDVFGYHFANVSIHAINSVLLFLLLQLTLQSSSSSELRNPWRVHASSVAGMVTLLWALHPMQTETVSYVTQRTELLMAFFFLSALYAARCAWGASSRRSEIAWQILSVIACGIGMGCKEVMVVAPVMVVIYDLTIMNRFVEKGNANAKSSLLRPKSDICGYACHRWTLYIGLFATWGILALLLATNPRGSSVGVNLDVGPFEYLALQFWAIVHYLRLALWPNPLVGDYGEFKPIPMTSWLPCLVILVLLAGCTIWAWFRKRPWSFPGLWVFLILAPTSSFIPIATEPIAERRMYLPLAAVMFLLVAGITALIASWSRQPQSLSNRLSTNQQSLVAFIVLTIATIYGVATFFRNEVFRTELAFWTDVTQKVPRNSRGFNVLGSTYMTEKQPELAFANLKHAIEIEPGESGALCNLGILFAEQGDIAESLAYFDQAIAVNPKLFDPHFNRGLLMLKQGQLDEAIKSLSAAIRLNPNVSNAYVILGSALFMKNEIDAAIEKFRLAVDVDPKSSDAYSNLGAALNRQGEFQQAMEMSRKSLAIEPTKLAALQNLADSLIGLGRADEAIPAYVECLKANPNDIQVLGKLGRAFVKVNKPDNAKQYFERLLELQPDSPETIRELQQLNK